MITIDQAINILAERTYQNTQDINRKNLQRRHQVVDLFGVPYSAQGDASSPASFYISVSEDMEYYERFQFKLIIGAFVSTIGSLSGTVGGTTGDVSLSINNINYNSYDEEFTVENAQVDPNPHSHTLDDIQLDASPGITQTETHSTSWKIVISNDIRTKSVDITPYLMLQYNGNWISGQGIFPSPKVNRDYDLLQVACDLEAEGKIEDRKIISDCGGKWIDVYSDAPFGATLVNYLKYSHLNR